MSSDERTLRYDPHWLMRQEQLDELLAGGSITEREFDEASNRFYPDVVGNNHPAGCDCLMCHPEPYPAVYEEKKPRA